MRHNYEKVITFQNLMPAGDSTAGGAPVLLCSHRIQQVDFDDQDSIFRPDEETSETCPQSSMNDFLKLIIFLLGYVFEENHYLLQGVR